jgi:hypothetical protein
MNNCDCNFDAILEPLKQALDRAWKDETPEQIIAIACNGLYWRSRPQRQCLRCGSPSESSIHQTKSNNIEIRMAAHSFVDRDEDKNKMKQSEVMRLREALKKISALDAAKDSKEGWNEWGESDCFRKAQRIAREALMAARK